MRLLLVLPALLVSLPLLVLLGLMVLGSLPARVRPGVLAGRGFVRPGTSGGVLASRSLFGSSEVCQVRVVDGGEVVGAGPFVEPC